MSSVPITVVIPVGPEEHYCRWLDEAIASVVNSTVMPKEILIVNDQAKVSHIEGSIAIWTTPLAVWRGPQHQNSVLVRTL